MPAGLGQTSHTTPTWEKHDLETLTLVLLQDRKVISIKVDDKETLTEGQWYYTLDFNSDDFKEQMGRHWSGVTWRVTLSKAWRPLYAAWECHNDTSGGKTG
jgi:hypothetical protein